MPDKEKYEDLVAECAETRRALDEDLHGAYGKLKKAAESVTGLPGKHFKAAVDLVHYQGGYPAPTSPPRAETLADGVAAVIKILDALDKQQLRSLLAKRGIEVKVTDPLRPSSPDKLLWKEAGLPHAEGGLDALKKLLAEALNLQEQICGQSDSIKLDGAKRAKELFEIEKPNFMKAVRLGAIQLRRGLDKMRPQLDKAQAMADNVAPSLEPLPLK